MLDQPVPKEPVVRKSRELYSRTTSSAGPAPLTCASVTDLVKLPVAGLKPRASPFWDSEEVMAGCGTWMLSDDQGAGGEYCVPLWALTVQPYVCPHWSLPAGTLQAPPVTRPESTTCVLALS